jgi:hypothetical protein
MELCCEQEEKENRGRERKKGNRCLKVRIDRARRKVIQDSY